jgi:hypothetical protein
MAVNQVQEWEIVIELGEGQRQALEAWEDLEGNVTMNYTLNDSELIITDFDCEYTAECCNDAIEEFLASL